MGESVFHSRGQAGRELSDWKTFIWVRERAEPAWLDAMAKGRMYTVLRSKEYGLVLDEFALLSEATGEPAISGQTVRAPALTPVLVHLAVSSDDGRSHQIPVQVIRSGRLMKTGTESVPFTLTLRDTAPVAGEQSYYRLMIGPGPDQQPDRLASQAPDRAGDPLPKGAALLSVCAGASRPLQPRLGALGSAQHRGHPRVDRGLRNYDRACRGRPVRGPGRPDGPVGGSVQGARC